MIDVGMRGGIPWNGIPPLWTCSGPRRDGKPAGLQVDSEAFTIEEITTVTTHQGNFIGEKRPGAAIAFHGSGNPPFFHVPSP